MTKATQRLALQVDRDDLGIGDAGARLELVLDLAGRDQEAAEPHGVARAGLIDEGAVAKPADVAGAEEAIRGDRIARRIGVVEIAKEARRRADLDLSGDAGSCELAGLGVAHADLRLGDIGQPPPSMRSAKASLARAIENSACTSLEP